MLAAKEKFRGHADVQIMTFPQAGILREAGTVEYLEESLKQGADVMGGIDPSQLDRDPVRHLDIVFGLAEKYQVEVDIHLHEPGALGVFSTELSSSARVRSACRARSRSRTPTTSARCRRP